LDALTGGVRRWSIPEGDGSRGTMEVLNDARDLPYLHSRAKPNCSSIVDAGLSRKMLPEDQTLDGPDRSAIRSSAPEVSYPDNFTNTNG